MEWFKKFNWKTILNKYDFSFSCIKILQTLYNLKSFLNNIFNNSNNIKIQNKNNFSEFIRQWLYKVTQSNIKSEYLIQRNINIIFSRFNSNKIYTLEELGIKYNLTRERIRQIIDKNITKLSSTISLNLLEPFWFILNSCIAKHGILTLSTLINKIAIIFKINYDLTEEFLFNLISLNKNFFKYITEKNKIKYLISKNFVCSSCEKIKQYIIDVIIIIRKITIEDFIKKINNLCLKECSKYNNQINKDLILFNLEYYLDNNIKYKNIYYYYINEWQIEFGNHRQAVINYLKKVKHPIHYSVMHKKINKIRNDNINEKHVYDALGNNKNAILWGRGTFIYIKNIIFPFHFIRKIENWLKSELIKDIPCISIQGVYTIFKEECKKNNITNEIALYSCLRISNDNELIYPKIPYVYHNKKYKNRNEVPIKIENYILEYGEPISREELNKYAVDELYLKDYSLNQYLSSSGLYYESRYIKALFA